MDPRAAAPPSALYGFEVKTIEGEARRLSGYQGRVLLIVNTASECGYTPQYEGLEALHRSYKDEGLRVLAFPANEFGSQEPGTDEQIRRFCVTRFAVSFDLFAKTVVKGPGIHPLYRWLTVESGKPGEITWNFEKFLVDRSGRVAARFEPEVEPSDPALIARLEKLLKP